MICTVLKAMKKKQLNKNSRHFFEVKNVFKDLNDTHTPYTRLRIQEIVILRSVVNLGPDNISEKSCNCFYIYNMVVCKHVGIYP